MIFNKEDLPYLSFSKAYLKQIRKYRISNERERQYLKEKSQSAKLFVQALEHRQNQIKKLGFCLIEHQRDFFNGGPEFLKPLKMTTIAQQIGMSVSTISRTANKKYVHTPYGLMPIRDFFLSSAGGRFKESDFSLNKIKKSLKEWVDKEEEPFSDQELKKKVEEGFGISFSRRRISQLRQSLDIPKARVRELKKLYAQ